MSFRMSSRSLRGGSRVGVSRGGSGCDSSADNLRRLLGGRGRGRDDGRDGRRMVTKELDQARVGAAGTHLSALTSTFGAGLLAVGTAPARAAAANMPCRRRASPGLTSGFFFAFGAAALCGKTKQRVGDTVRLPRRRTLMLANEITLYAALPFDNNHLDGCRTNNLQRNVLKRKALLTKLTRHCNRTLPHRKPVSYRVI
eukprot:9488745-Pyramimonas_sp.AAC.3